MTRLRRSPVARFSAISFLTMLGLGVVLGNMLERRIDDRALSSAATSAEVLGEIAVRRYIPREELRTGLSPTTIKDLDSHLRPSSLQSVGVDKVKVFDGARKLVYSNDGSEIGNVSPPESNVGVALGGERVEGVSRGTNDDGEGEYTLSVYAPLRYGPGKAPAGAFEVYLDYGPTAAAAARDIRRMWVFVGAGLILLWAVLFPLVSSVSRALRRQIEQNRRQATRDALTGLPNRTLLFERLGDTIGNGTAALLQLDLDGFREINDTLGHDHGDELLIEVSRRLRAAAHEDDFVARLGGDEFAVLRPGIAGETEALRLADRLIEALRTPIDVRGTTIVVDATVGVALAPDHGDDATTLARLAEVAMYQGKRAHGGVWIYDSDRDTHNRGRLELLGELGPALRHQELVMAYQPKVALATGEICGVEALMRWQHPERGLLMPGAFIPAAEVTSIVRPLTLYAIEAGLRAYRRWTDAGLYLPVAVNLAGPCVMDDSMPDAVAALLADLGVAPEALTLEISESTMMSDIARALRVLDAFRSLGVRLSLDDFGTGQTSLGQLRQLPLHEMKVDRSLVIGDQRLLASIVEMGHKFGLRTVGEGVETVELAEALTATGCDEAQGFLFARPMWADAIPAWVAERDAAKVV